MEEFESRLRSLADEEGEYNLGTSTSGTEEEFCDYLAPDEVEAFQQLAELADKKKKWLRIFDKMLYCIKTREFEQAREFFELLVQELL